MSKFGQVLSLTFSPDTDKTAATHYDTATVRLFSKTYDRSPNKYNLYEIDMNSVDCGLDKETHEITIAAGSAGDWVQIQKGLSPEASHETKPGIFECGVEDALVEDNLLTVADIKKAVNVRNYTFPIHQVKKKGRQPYSKLHSRFYPVQEYIKSTTNPHIFICI